MGYNQQFAENRKAGSTRDLTPEFVEFKKAGDLIVGMLIAIVKIDAKRGVGQFNQYLFDTDNGRVKFQLGQATDSEVAAAMVPGNVYAVEFKGKETLKSGFQRNMFSVMEVLDAEGNPVTGNIEDVPF